MIIIIIIGIESSATADNTPMFRVVRKPRSVCMYLQWSPNGGPRTNFIPPADKGENK